MKNIPLTLRLELARAALFGEFVSISVDAANYDRARYRFDVHAGTIKGWLKRRNRKNRVL